MHANFSTALIIAALAGSIILVLNRGDRLFPVIALVTAGLEALIVFGIIQLSISTFRIDIILPALLTLSGAICWSKSSEKTTITSATIVTLVGLVQLLIAIRLLR